MWTQHLQQQVCCLHWQHLWQHFRHSEVASERFYLYQNVQGSLLIATPCAAIHSDRNSASQLVSTATSSCSCFTYSLEALILRWSSIFVVNWKQHKDSDLNPVMFQKVYRTVSTPIVWQSSLEPINLVSNLKLHLAPSLTLPLFQDKLFCVSTAPILLL